MAITIVTRASKAAPLNATEHDANLENLAKAIENTSTGHDHDGSDSKKISAANVVNTPAGDIAAITVQAALNELDAKKLSITGYPIHEVSEFPDDHTAAGLALLDDETAAAQRTTLGLGTIATQNANNVNISGGAVAGITDLAIADGGTGASTAATARTALGVAIGVDVMAYEAWPIHEVEELCSVD